MSARKKYLVELDNEDLELDYADAGPWRSYHLTTMGDTLDDLIANAEVSEVDQDGGDLASYPLKSRGGPLFDAAEKMIERALDDARRPESPESVGERRREEAEDR